MAYMTRLRSGTGARKNYRSLAGLTTRKRTAPKKPRLAKPAASAVRRIVKAEISRQSEDKMVSILREQSHNSSIANTGDLYQLVPDISLGTDSNQRIGDSVRPKRLKCVFKVSLDSGDYSNNATLIYPIEARLLIVKQKTIKNWGQSGTFDFAHLLRTNEGGSSAERQYTGDKNDNMRQINTDLFEVLMDKRITLKPQYTTQTSPTQAEGPLYPMLPNCVYITKYIKLPKKLTFDDGNTTNPNNFCPMATIGYCYPGPQLGPDAINTQVHMSVLSTLYYEDS